MPVRGPEDPRAIARQFRHGRPAIPAWPATITTSGGNSICRVPHLARKFGLDVEVSLGTQRSQTLADVPETARRSLAVSGMAL